MDVARPHHAIAPGTDGDVLVALARTDDWLTGREAARLAGAPPSTGQRALHRLAEHGLVDVRSAGRALLYRLNRDHVAAPVALALAGLRAELVDRLRHAVGAIEPAPVHASLYGSAARQDGGRDSDIDVFLVRPDGVSEDDEGWARGVDDLRSAVERWTGNAVQILELGEREARALPADDPSSTLVAGLRRDAVDLAGVPARRLLERA